MKLAVVIGGRERRVREVDVAVFTDYDVVGRIQALALVALRQHFDFPLTVGSCESTQMSLARVQTPLRVERISVGAVRILTKHDKSLARHELKNAIRWDIAEIEEPVPRPHRPLGERESSDHLLDLNFRTFLLLRSRGRRDEDHSRYCELCRAGWHPAANCKCACGGADNRIF